VKLIVGLGNPGRKYEYTRHNLGFILIDRLIARGSTISSRTEFEAIVTKVSLADQNCLLAKPQTFMNLSGKAVSALAAKHHIETDSNLLVLYDDVALPVGKQRIRPNGSAGGHNGMKSIIAELGNKNNFPRLRLGIKPTEPIIDLADFVLSRFDIAEKDLIDQMLSRAEETVDIWLKQGIDKAMAFANAEVAQS
jgi:peptidyl-tRNA hydrolase, PTH1 family